VDIFYGAGLAPKIAHCQNQSRCEWADRDKQVNI
jgi:hypothetical protein